MQPAIRPQKKQGSSLQFEMSASFFQIPFSEFSDYIYVMQ